MRTRTKQSFVVVLTALSGLCLSAPAMADARTEARAHFRKGMALVLNGQYDEGIDELKIAHDTLPHPDVLYNIARAYVAMGHLESAVSYYEKYIDTNPADKDEAMAVAAALRARVARQRATLEAAEAMARVSPESTGDKSGRTKGQTPTLDPSTASSERQRGLPEARVEDRGLEGARQQPIYEESVAAASKGSALSPLDAPNSVTIITEQDIRLSGMLRISDLLRRVAGIDIIDATNGYADMSMRGFNQRMSNKLLILVDGRSVQVEFFGNFFESWLPTDVHDIERIEVVRGPGSALYGADAFAGVVNIVLKRPGVGSNSLRVGAGPRGEAYGSLVATGRSGDVDYRVSGGYTRFMRWSRQVQDGRVDVKIVNSDQELGAENSRFHFQSKRHLGKNLSIELSGGYADAFTDFYAIGIFRGYQQDVRNGYAQAKLQANKVSLRVAYNAARAINNASSFNYIGQTLYGLPVSTDVVDTEFVYADDFKTGPLGHTVNLGINYKYRHVESVYTDKVTENFLGFFAQEALKASKHFVLIASGRLDYLPYTEMWEASPRVSLLVHPSERSTIRGSFATAFRKPTSLEGYLSTGIQSTSGDVQAFNDSNRVELKPERVLSAEVGYVNQEADWLSLNTAAYYNRVTDLVVLDVAPPVTPTDRIGNPLFDSRTGRYTVALTSFTNQCAEFNVFGGEVGARVFPVTGLDLFANYAYNHVVAVLSPGCDIPDDKRTSAHKVNAGVQVRSEPGIDGEVSVNYVGSQVWSERIVTPSGSFDHTPFPLDAYVLLNARLGYRFADNHVEVGVMGTNLLNQKHKEHPFTQDVGQRFMGFAFYHF